jgi:hypothetical protein
MFFKREIREEAAICFHRYSLVDFHSFVDSSMAIENYYEIGCVKCGTKRTVDEIGYSDMKKIGLISEEADDE